MSSLLLSVAVQSQQMKERYLTLCPPACCLGGCDRKKEEGWLHADDREDR